MANPYFNAAYYLEQNTDVAEGGYTLETAEDHYNEYGAGEGRAPNEWFNAQWYLDQYPDLEAGGITLETAFGHFAQYGMYESRDPSEGNGVNRDALSAYAAENEDLRDAFGIDDADNLTTEQEDALIQHYYAYGYQEDRPGAPVDGDNGDDNGGTPGETFMLTEGRDSPVGTDNDDTFVGLVGQNQNGTLTNALSTGDYIDGGAGRDKIVATVIQDQTATGILPLSPINARTENVEVVELEALKSSSFFIPDLSGDGDIEVPVDILDILGVNTVQVDAGRMNSVEEFWSDNSSADLLITDVRLGDKLNITKDITFGVRDTDYDTSFVALFDSQSLRAAPDTTSNSQLLVRIADVSTETPTTPLANVNLNLSFNLGDDVITLEDLQSTDGSYAGLVEAINVALDAAGYPDLVVELSTPYQEVTVAGNTVTLPFTAQEILITDPNGDEFSDVNFTQSAIAPVPDGFLVAGNAAPVDPSEISNLIESNLILDNAGRGSLAGDVLVGGMSNSQKGVEQFNVTVDRSSKIEGLYTTGNMLQEIHIDSMGANGDLWIGGTEDNLKEINANAFAGENLSLGQGDTGYGGWNDDIENLGFLNAGDTAANVTYVGENYGGNAAVIHTGSGDDEITVNSDGESGSGSTPSALSIDAGEGDNTVVLTSWTFDSIDNTAIVITGSGTDEVHGGANSLTAHTGAGDDVIYAENTGSKAVGEISAGATASLMFPSGSSSVLYNQLLGGRDVQVTLALPNSGNSLTPFTSGFETTVRVEASDGYLTTERDLYEAVARAINDDPVLNKLAKAEVDSNGDFTVNYLVDGDIASAENAVHVQVLGDWSDLSGPAQNNILNQLKSDYHDSTIAATDVATAYDDVSSVSNAFVPVTTGGGNSASNGGTNIVNGGLGDDVIVLSSGTSLSGESDTVEFDAGGFGNDTIVHFTAGTSSSGGDVLDFTDWLDNEFSHSGSSASIDRVVTTLDTTAFTANRVVVTDFNTLDGAASVSLDFDTLTGAEVLAALNQPGDYTVVAPTGPNFQGNTQKSIMFVENVDNEGEYKVFEVTSGITGGEDFTGVTLVGSLDFGETQTFVVDNFA